MYDELVKQLREADEKSMCGECGLNLHTGATKKGVLFAEAADAIEELSKPKWIPVTERLPRDRQFVLVYCGDNKRIRPSDRFDVAILLGDSIFTSLGVTHWMPLPTPPKEE